MDLFERYLKCTGFESLREWKSLATKQPALEDLSNLVPKLLTTAPLPLLLKLLEFNGYGLNCDKIQFKLRPVILLPVSRALDSQVALAQILAEVRERVAGFGQSPNRPELYGALDYWGLEIKLELIIETLRQIQVAFPQLNIIAPSSNEMKQIADYNQITISDLLSCLKQAGLSELDMSYDTNLLQIASDRNFKIRLGLPLTNPSDFTQVLVDVLAATRQGKYQLAAVYPFTERPLDTLDHDGPFGCMTLRAVALLRLLFPAPTTVRAPISHFGIKAANVALAHGAEDLGYVGYDRESVERFGLLPLSEVLSAFSYSGFSLLPTDFVIESIAADFQPSDQLTKEVAEGKNLQFNYQWQC